MISFFRVCRCYGKDSKLVRPFRSGHIYPLDQTARCYNGQILNKTFFVLVALKWIV